MVEMGDVAIHLTTVQPMVTASEVHTHHSQRHRHIYYVINTEVYPGLFNFYPEIHVYG